VEAAWHRRGELLRDIIGTDAFFGESDYSILERRWARPTLDVHGIRGGFTGDGAKDGHPPPSAQGIDAAGARPGPPGIFEAFEARVQELATPGVKLTVRAINTDPPVTAPPVVRGVQAAMRALERGYGKKAEFLRMGGSIPVMTVFPAGRSAVEVVCTGSACPTTAPLP